MHTRIAALALVLSAAPAWAAVSVYGHAPTIDPFTFGGASSYYSATSNRHVSRGVMLGQTVDLSAVRFWGGVVGALAVQPGAFRISIWNSDGVSDNGISGSPGSLLFRQETLATDTRFAVRDESPVQPLLKRYDIDLGTTVRFEAGVRYWISIEGRSESALSFDWAWAQSDTSSGYWSGYNIFSIDSWVTQEPTPFPHGGEAFELFAIPSPAALTLLTLAASITARRRR